LSDLEELGELDGAGHLEGDIILPVSESTGGSDSIPGTAYDTLDEPILTSIVSLTLYRKINPIKLYLGGTTWSRGGDDAV